MKISKIQKWLKYQNSMKLDLCLQQDEVKAASLARFSKTQNFSLGNENECSPF